MRTSEVLLSVGLLALAFGLSPAVSFDGRPEVVPMPNAAGPSTPQMNTSATPLVAVPILLAESRAGKHLAQRITVEPLDG